MGRKKKTVKHIFIPLAIYKEIVDGYENYDVVTIEAVTEEPVVIKGGTDERSK